MSPSPTQQMSASPKVLVVEDEPILRFLISDVLANDHGLTVVEAESGDVALHALEENADIACVFTDVRMPGMLDGIALTRRLKQERPSIKVLVTSGHLRSAAEIDHVPFVAKPYNLEQVAKMIEELVRSFGAKQVIGK